MKSTGNLKYIIPITCIVLLLAIILRFDLLKNKKTTGQNPAPTTQDIKEPDINSLIETKIVTPPSEKKKYTYVEVMESCSAHYEGICVNARTGPGSEFPIKMKLRTGIVLHVADEPIHTEQHDWYRVIFDSYLLFPERIDGDMYIAGDVVRIFYDEGDMTTKDASTTTTKKIIVDISEQMIYAYNGQELFMKQLVSTGLELTPTEIGEFKIYKKTPSRYMQGPTKGMTDQYDLPGVPWDLYFTYDGSVIHGAYWHNSFGKRWSHGCVNLPLDKSKELYEWAEVGTPVIVQD